MCTIASMVCRLMKLDFQHAHHRRSAAQKACCTVASSPLPASPPPSSSSLPSPAHQGLATAFLPLFPSDQTPPSQNAGCIWPSALMAPRDPTSETLVAGPSGPWRGTSAPCSTHLPPGNVRRTVSGCLSTPNTLPPAGCCVLPAPPGPQGEGEADMHSGVCSASKRGDISARPSPTNPISLASGVIGASVVAVCTDDGLGEVDALGDSDCKGPKSW